MVLKIGDDGGGGAVVGWCVAMVMMVVMVLKKNIGQPSRTAQPVIRYVPIDSEPKILENFPYDKVSLPHSLHHHTITNSITIQYEVENSPLTAYLCGYKQQQGSGSGCWYTYIIGSSGANKPPEPFGYIKPGTQGNTISLFVLPYNFPRLWVLLGMFT